MSPKEKREGGEIKPQSRERGEFNPSFKQIMTIMYFLQSARKSNKRFIVSCVENLCFKI